MNGTINTAGSVQSDTTVASATIAITYDPATRSYTLARQGGNKAFRQTDLTLVDSTSPRIPYANYLHTLSDGSEELFISQMPGTADARLNYVGNGVYLEQHFDGSKYSVTGDAFYFGIPTAAGSLPTTGSATYNVSLLGYLAAHGGTAFLIKGGNPGTLNADFALGTVSVNGIASYIDLINGGGTGNNGGGGFGYSGTATIGSGSAFSGNFTLAAVGGSWSGQFFGPAGTEVGARFLSGSGSTQYVGTLVGSSDLAFRGIETSFIGLRNIVGFGAVRIESYHQIDPATGRTTRNGGGVSDAIEINSNTPVRYNLNNDWQFANTFNYLGSTINAATSDSAFTVYGNISTKGNGAGMRILKPGAGNPLIALTYTSFAEFALGGSDFRRDYNVFGFRTEPGDVPATGTASYSALVRGLASRKDDFNNGDMWYALGGSTTLGLDFGAGTWSGMLALTGEDLNSSAIRDFGSFSTSTGQITGNRLSQANILGVANADIGDIFGYLFGPRAAEVGGGFSIDMGDPEMAGRRLDIDGVFFGKKN